MAQTQLQETIATAVRRSTAASGVTELLTDLDMLHAVAHMLGR